MGDCIGKLKGLLFETLDRLLDFEMGVTNFSLCINRKVKNKTFIQWLPIDNRHRG